MPIRAILTVVLFAVMSSAVAAQTLRVIDGDTIEIGSTTIRIEGIDAPEAGQTCKNAAGRFWQCGEESTKALKSLLRGKRVSCTPLSLDTYGRTIANCSAGDKDIGSEMVSSGWAWAFRRYSTTYVNEEQAAEAAGVGIWQGESLPAWEYRSLQWNNAQRETATSEDGTCLIKGNISSNGKIYHAPWHRSYASTKINTSKGERWFCTEGDARAAGWRAPRN